MVNQIFIDLQKIKCCSLPSTLPVKIERSKLFAVDNDTEKNKFLKTIHRKELSWKENLKLIFVILPEISFPWYTLWLTVKTNLNIFQYTFVHLRRVPKNLVFATYRILMLFTCEDFTWRSFFFFVKRTLLFHIFYCFCMFVSKHLAYQKFACLKN